VRKADNLPPSCAVVTKSGNLNFLQPSGPVQACNGTALYIYIYIYTPMTAYIHIQGGPKVGIQYIVNYCIPTFSPLCVCVCVYIYVLIHSFTDKYLFSNNNVCVILPLQSKQKSAVKAMPSPLAACTPLRP